MLPYGMWLFPSVGERQSYDGFSVTYNPYPLSDLGVLVVTSGAKETADQKNGR